MAPCANASATKSWPSRAACSATKHAPGASVRESLASDDATRVAGAGDERPARHRGDLRGSQLHPSAPSSSRDDVAVVERQSAPPIVWPVSGPLPAITTTSPAAAVRERVADRGAAVELDDDLAAAAEAREHRVGDPLRILGPRVVRRQHHQVGAARPRPPP